MSLYRSIDLMLLFSICELSREVSLDMIYSSWHMIKLEHLVVESFVFLRL